MNKALPMSVSIFFLDKACGYIQASFRLKLSTFRPHNCLNATV